MQLAEKIEKSRFFKKHVNRTLPTIKDEMWKKLFKRRMKAASICQGGKIMATRDSIDHFLQTCENVILKAQEQYQEGALQGHYHDVEYREAMQELENLYNEWLQLYNSANPQQREQLYRKRLQIQDMQNKMILLNHDR
jgi:hypothetical protein